jgi:hypothetical protein
VGVNYADDLWAECSKWEKRAGYDILMGRVEKILVPMNEFGKSAGEAICGFAVDFCLQSQGFIKVPSPQKNVTQFRPQF